MTEQMLIKQVQGMETAWTYVCGGIGTFLVSLILTPLMMTLARGIGVVDLPNARKVHNKPIPRSGGIAMGLASAAGLIALFTLVPSLQVSLEGQRITFLTFCATSVAALAMGLADDFFNVPSLYKLVVLLLAAGMFASSGQQLTSIDFAGYSFPLHMASWPVTVLWLVSVPVALNFMDGLDGLAGGFSAAMLLFIGVASVLCGAVHVAMISFILLGAVGGFLVFNWHPAKVFMGDAGSMFLGFAIAALALMGSAYASKPQFVTSAAIAFSVPFLDAALTFVRRRVLLRRSLFSAERGHIHHRLLDLGLGQFHAVLLLCGAAGCSAVVATVVMYAQPRVTTIAIGIEVCMLIGLFRSAGSARVRDTVEAVRRNRKIKRGTRHYRAAFEDMQMRFRLARTFNDWWREVCKAAESLDFVQVTIPITPRKDGPTELVWKNEKQFGDDETLGAVVPITDRRPGGALRAQIEVATDGTLESAGERIALFTRLMSEFSVKDIPDPKAAPAKFSFLAAIKIYPMRSVVRERAHRKLPAHREEVPYANDKPVAELKVAIVHDFLYTYGGAERVLEQLIELFPHADLFSLFDFLAPGDRGFIKNKPVTTTFLQKMPFARTKHRAYLPLMPLAIEQIDVSKYDLVISSSYVAAKGILTGPDQLHVCYCHSPVRFAWDLQHQYLGEAGMSGLFGAVKSLIARSILHYTRMWDVRSSVGVDVFLANSLFVGRRIEKVYRRQSVPLYPPVDIHKFTVSAQKEDFYLSASRLVPYKRTSLIVEAFNRMPEKKLIVVGEGPEYDRIKAMAGPNVSVMGHQPFERLKSLMQHAKAFVFAAEEDFGIVAVEAQACGTPVIAFGRGGATETVVHGKTGLFFSEQTPESLMSAVYEFEQRTWDAELIRRNAEAFSTEMFRTNMQHIIDTEWKSFTVQRKRRIADVRTFGRGRISAMPAEADRLTITDSVAVTDQIPTTPAKVG